MPKHRKNKNLQISSKSKIFTSSNTNKSIEEEANFDENSWLFCNGKEHCNQTGRPNGTSVRDSWNTKKSKTSLKKTVSFSNPLVFGSHEIEKLADRKSVPKKATCLQIKNMPKTDASLSKNLNEFAKWTSKCSRWVARIEDMIELDLNAVKHLSSEGPVTNVIRFCDNQRHLYLGSGPDFTSVYMGVTNAGDEVAVKKINVKRAPLLHDTELVNKLLSLSPHPSLLMTRFIIRDKSHFYVVRDLADYTLKEKMSRRKFISEGLEAPWNSVCLCSQIANAIEHLHSNGILHMAIKPENIMIRSDGEMVYTCDFGIHDRIASKSAKEGSNTRCWLATEILKLQEEGGNSAGHTKESDIASLGMLFYYIITGGGHPYGDQENAPANCIKTIMHGSYNLKALDDPFAHHLVKNMIFKESEKRFCISQVVEHPYFWSEECRDEYARLLIQCFVNISNTCGTIRESSLLGYKDFMDCVTAMSSDILGSYVKKSIHIPKKTSSNLYSLFSYLDAVNDNSISASFEEPLEPQSQKSWSLYPGILLSTYADLPLDRMRQIAKSLETVLPRNKKPVAVFSHCSVDSGLESPESLDDAFAPLSLDERVTSSNIPVPLTKDFDVFDDGDPLGSFQEDDGIDVLTPLSGNLIDGNPFFPGERMLSSPIQFNEVGTRTESMAEHRALSPGSYSSTVDNFFEFDKGDCVHDVTIESSEAAFESSVQKLAAQQWTDIDELD